MEITHTSKVEPKRQACIIDGTSIAGCSRVDNIDEVLNALNQGDRLEFRRDKDNFFDEWAIKIFDSSGNRMGFVSCECNEVLSRMIDAGFKVEGLFDSAEHREGWTDIKIKVMLYG